MKGTLGFSSKEQGLKRGLLFFIQVVNRLSNLNFKEKR